MRIFLTGGTGFIGGRIARQARERGDEVVCLVRDRARASSLEALGCELLVGDIADGEVLTRGCTDAEAVIHGAAIYKVGIPNREKKSMWAANVDGTRNVLTAALDAGTAKVVYISTVAVFGNTHGEIVDEGYRRGDFEFTSYYEETKYRAHEVAEQLIAERGLPASIAQPGGVYGPGDESSLGKALSQFADGRMPALPFPDLGLSLVHVDDAATGVLSVLDRGQNGRSYVLGGEIATMRKLIETAARLLGKRPPRMSVPTGMLKALKPFGPLVGAGMGQPPNLGELITSADGVTFWATSDRAVTEIGYVPRGLEAGLKDTFEAEGRLPRTGQPSSTS